MHFKISSAIYFNLNRSKILLSGNGLNLCNKGIWEIINNRSRSYREKVNDYFIADCTTLQKTKRQEGMHTSMMSFCVQHATRLRWYTKMVEQSFRGNIKT